MSDTPRTDELAQGWDEGLAMPSQMLTLAWQLERENAALRDKLAVLERDYAALDDRYERLVEKEAQP